MVSLLASPEFEIFNPEILRSLSTQRAGYVREYVSASSLTTFSAGGDLRALVTVENIEELQRLVTQLSSEGQLFRVIGNGSNVLVGDNGVQEWIVRLGAGFRAIETLGSGEFDVHGSVSLMTLARRLSDDGFSGLEFAAGIPASVGGAVFMNAGAHGAEIAERIVSLRAVLPDGTQHLWSRDELPWGYRSSGIPSGAVVTSVRLSLVQGDRAEISERCRKNLQHRRATQPLSQPSAGSVFRNPSAESPAGLLLERAGLKGERCGGARVSELHANWIVNPERVATAADIRALMQHCRDRARELTGIVLEPEVKMWGLAPLI
jgi:UDP-N-acetylmuramate dehydrogenase